MIVLDCFCFGFACNCQTLAKNSRRVVIRWNLSDGHSLPKQIQELADKYKVREMRRRFVELTRGIIGGPPAQPNPKRCADRSNAAHYNEICSLPIDCTRLVLYSYMGRSKSNPTDLISQAM